jgi:acetoin:2,6-dichlorophenolindophenol oxidoreductase subunit alpha
MLEQAKNDFQKGKPILIYHNEEDETALVVASEFMTEDLYKVLRKYATGDIAVMLDQNLGDKVGISFLSDALNLAAELNPQVDSPVKQSHAGPTFDLKSVKTGSADSDKIQGIKEFAYIALHKEYDMFNKNFIIPGHVRTYIARRGLLDERIGHTELGVFFSKYCNLSGVVCMVTIKDDSDGHPFNKFEAEKFAKEHNYPIVYEDEILEVFRTYHEHKDKVIQAPANEYLSNYSKLKYIRKFEETLENLFRSNKIRGSYHLAIGQEATGVALGNVLKENDVVFTSHRGHHIALGMGVNPKKFFDECIGKATGLNAGHAGPMHFYSKEDGLWGANGIVAANAGISLGVALSKKIDNGDGIVVNVIGEGSTDEGISHEALNQAALWDLPMMIVCENNLYSQTTKFENHIPVKDLSYKIEESYGIHSEKIMLGTDLVHLQTRLQDIVAWIRENKKPVFVEVMTYRFCGHSMSDQDQGYKIIDVDQQWKIKDPVDVYKKYLVDNNIVHPEDILNEDHKIEDNIRSLYNDIL